jgi:photosystem II stability/assembly factor-like uncharacterized protein
MQPTVQPTSIPSSKPTANLLASTWFEVQAGESSDAYFGATWTTSLDCVLVGRQFFDGVIIVTHDRGSSWNRTLVSDTPFTHVASYDDGDYYYHLVTSTTGDLYWSTDNGDSWTLLVYLPATFYSVAIGSDGKFISLSLSLSLYV